MVEDEVAQSIYHHTDAHCCILSHHVARHAEQCYVECLHGVSQHQHSEELKPETEQKTYKEQRHLISQAMIVRLEHPVFVPDEAIDYARNVANHIGKHKLQAKQFVAHKNHSERDERVAHAHQSIFH